jgi:cell division septum initiation protein DivIVA
MVLDYAKLSIIALKAIDTLHEENQLLRKELEELKEKVNTKRTRRKKTE